MSGKNQYGKSVNVLKFSTDNKVLIEMSELDKMMLQVSNRKIVFVSIIGTVCSGNSFFLDYCLRYMYANVSKLRTQ